MQKANQNAKLDTNTKRSITRKKDKRRYETVTHYHFYRGTAHAHLGLNLQSEHHVLEVR